MLRCVMTGWLLAVAGTATSATAAEAKATPAEPPTRARVVIVHDPAATTAFKAHDETVRSMVRLGLRTLTGQTDLTTAWRSLISTQDVVGIRVVSAPGPLSGTRPAVVAAVIEDLLAAGLPPTNLIIWDRRMANLRQAGFVALAERWGVRVGASTESGWDPDQSYDFPLLGRLVWGDFEFGRQGQGVGRRSFVSTLVSRQMTRLIQITPLLNHNVAGVSGNLYGLALDSVDNTLRFEGQADLLARAVPEIYALPVLGDRVALNIVDALVCQYQGEETMLLHYSVPLNQLRFSTDPVALDILSLEELKRQREAARMAPIKTPMELYHGASELWIGVSEPKRIEVEKVP